MDGIDAALVRISGPSERPRVRLLAFETVAYDAATQRMLLDVASGEEATAGTISQLNRLLGELFAESVLRVCRRAGIPPQRLGVVGSHGQTIYHQGKPALISEQKTLVGPNTFQIAEPSIIAERTRAPVVADFRTADMAAGGQGAPLVPMVDYLLLRDDREGTVALNIGGIANVTVIPVNAKPDQVFGFDTGPGNMLIDGLVRHFSGGRSHFDKGGRLAASGKLLELVLARALAFAFFNRTPPKSAGREQFGAWFMDHYFLKRQHARGEDLLRTATELTAKSIAEGLERFVFPRVKVHRLIVSGGGAHNQFLMGRVKRLLPQIRVDLSDKYGLPTDAKEAIAFALLADRTLHGLPGNLPRVTGARRAVVLGKLVRS
jgi:anhydro-N-acetylmuramic acid kinase